MIKPLVRRLVRLMATAGFDISKLVTFIIGMPRYFLTMYRYSRSGPPSAFTITLANLMPIVSDWTGQAGTAKGHYFHQDLWAARKIYRKGIRRHFDIGSRIDGFIAHLLVFSEVEIIDILPLESQIAGLKFKQDDATTLASIPSDSIESLSSLHAAEHFGLGRYSDPIDPQGYEKFIHSLARVFAPSGTLYFSVPIGRERLEFNAHRVFHQRTIIQLFSSLELKSFSFVDDKGSLHENCSPHETPVNLEYGCGLFEFEKKQQ